MRIAILSTVAATLLCAPALAQEVTAPAAASLVLKVGQMVKTVDGQSVGRVDEVQSDGGQPVSVSIIYNQHFIHVPVSTLSAGTKGLVTSLTNKEVSRLN